MSLFIPYPLCKTFAPKQDGIFVVKRQGKVVYVGVAHKEKTGKNLKQAIKALFKTGNEVHEHFYEMSKIMSVKWIKQPNYEKCVEEQKKLIEKYKTYNKYNKKEI